MRSIRLAALSGMLSLLALASADAQLKSPEQPGPRFFGIGGMTCGKYLEVLDQKNEAWIAAFDSWLGGFESGANAAGVMLGKADILATTEMQTVRTLSEKYCREHPQDLFSTAATYLMLELINRIEKK